MNKLMRLWRVSLSVLLVCLLLLTGCQKTTSYQETGVEKGMIDSIEVEEVAKGFSGADGVVVDYLGNIFVGNRKSNMLSKVTTEGEVVDFVKLSCQELLCLTVDQENNIYAAGKDQVFKISQEGAVEVIADGFTCADDLRLDKKGNVFVTDSFENRVYKITPNNKKSIFIDNDIDEKVEPFVIGRWYITGITFDHEYKNLYIARMHDGEILKYPIKPDGTAGAPEIVAEGLQEPDHLEMDEKGNLYVTLFRVGSLLKIDPTGKIETIFSNKLEYATGVAFGKTDLNKEYLFIADLGRNTLYKVFVGEVK